MNFRFRRIVDMTIEQRHELWKEVSDTVTWEDFNKWVETLKEDYEREVYEGDIAKGCWLKCETQDRKHTVAYECSNCGRNIYVHEDLDLIEYPYCHCGSQNI